MSRPKSTIVLDWNNRVPKKVNILAWRVAHGRIPTRANLLKRGIGTNPMCILCEQETETEEHLFLNCIISVEVWNSLKTWWRTLPDSLLFWKNGTSNITLQLQSAIMLVYIWIIWNYRNSKAYSGKIKSHNEGGGVVVGSVDQIAPINGVAESLKLSTRLDAYRMVLSAVT
ncbi:unnamed protein product [Lactuca saligna]|uniref:Reverse transcriptase zinc-binding domain-containing protein n=1 Tax=Lactuca saligna TaxID=75948 RepID=A0AA36EM77_LACSI|nr:unnamed protein product [Lactuca saligna]